MLFLWKTWTHTCDTFSLKYPSTKKSGNWQVSTSVCFREMTLVAFHFLSYSFTHCFPAMYFFLVGMPCKPMLFLLLMISPWHLPFHPWSVFPEQQSFPLLLCHNNKIKRVDVGCSEPGLLYWVQPPRLGLLLFYIYHLLSCSCGKRNKCLLNSYFSLYLHSPLFCSSNDQKNKYYFDSGFLLIYIYAGFCTQELFLS